RTVGLAEERQQASRRLEELAEELFVRLQLSTPQSVRAARSSQRVARAARRRVKKGRSDVIPQDPVPLLDGDCGRVEQEVVLCQARLETRRRERDTRLDADAARKLQGVHV